MKCPQQTNVSDCGVYAVKFIQCLVMGTQVVELQASRMKDHLIMFAQDLLLWDFTDAKHLPITCCNSDTVSDALASVRDADDDVAFVE